MGITVGLLETKQLTPNVLPICFYTKVVCRVVCQRSLGSTERKERSPRKIKCKLCNISKDGGQQQAASPRIDCGLLIGGKKRILDWSIENVLYLTSLISNPFFYIRGSLLYSLDMVLTVRLYTDLMAGTAHLDWRFMTTSCCRLIMQVSWERQAKPVCQIKTVRPKCPLIIDFASAVHKPRRVSHRPPENEFPYTSKSASLLSS